MPSPPALLPKGEGSERQALERYARFVEQKVLAAADERTRTIRQFILAATEVALRQAQDGMKAEG